MWIITPRKLAWEEFIVIKIYYLYLFIIKVFFGVFFKYLKNTFCVSNQIQKLVLDSCHHANSSGLLRTENESETAHFYPHNHSECSLTCFDSERICFNLSFHFIGLFLFSLCWMYLSLEILLKCMLWNPNGLFDIEIFWTSTSILSF